MKPAVRGFVESKHRRSTLGKFRTEHRAPTQGGINHRIDSGDWVRRHGRRVEIMAPRPWPITMSIIMLRNILYLLTLMKQLGP